MPKFSLTEARNRHGEVFDSAIAGPVVLTKRGRPTHVVLSAGLYEEMVTRLAELEDQALAEEAANALESQDMVGSRKFTAALRKMIDAKH